MKPCLAALPLILSMLRPCRADPVPVIEQGIYHPAPPFVDIKQSLYVTERERPQLERIASASDALVLFLIDMHDSRKTAATIRHVLDGARPALRLPPPATFPVGGRYVNATLYCWESDDENHLQFLIEWADVTTRARYTDSYVFVRRGSSWYFEKHGSYAPWHWTQTERYFQRVCPASSQG